MKTHGKFSMSLPQWVRATVGAIYPQTDISFWRFKARKEIAHYVGHNLGEFPDDRFGMVRGSALCSLRVRSAHPSARSAFRAEYAISRALRGSNLRAISGRSHFASI